MDALSEHLAQLSRQAMMPSAHTAYLETLSRTFHPRVCYDIGACVLHWTHAAQAVWRDAEYVLFDAFEPAAFLYEDYKHHVGVLSDVDGKQVRFHQNDYLPGGNSYYREVGSVFPADKYISKTCATLDAVVRARNLPLPDLIKIDAQGSELDILNGARETLRHAKYLIVELQHTEYNEGAPRADYSVPYIESLGWRCIAPLFCHNGADGDYCFENLNHQP